MRYCRISSRSKALTAAVDGGGYSDLEGRYGLGFQWPRFDLWFNCEGACCKLEKSSMSSIRMRPWVRRRSSSVNAAIRGGLSYWRGTMEGSDQLCVKYLEAPAAEDIGELVRNDAQT